MGPGGQRHARQPRLGGDELAARFAERGDDLGEPAARGEDRGLPEARAGRVHRGGSIRAPVERVVEGGEPALERSGRGTDVGVRLALVLEGARREERPVVRALEVLHPGGVGVGRGRRIHDECFYRFATVRGSSIRSLIDVRAYARLMAELAVAGVRGRAGVLAAHALDEDAWSEIDAHWQAELSDALAPFEDDVPPLLSDYATAYASRQREIASPVSIEQFAEVTRLLHANGDFQAVPRARADQDERLRPGERALEQGDDSRSRDSRPASQRSSGSVEVAKRTSPAT